MPVNLKGRSFITLKDFTTEEIRYMLNLSKDLKAKKRTGSKEKVLEGKNIVLLFEKSSTRTRCAFEVAAYDEGANVTFLTNSQMGKKESIEDTANVLGRYYDGIEFRGFKQETVESLAAHSGVPVWNGLTDLYHPTQILADFLTVMEHVDKPLNKVKFVYVGDARNNMGNSLMIGAAKMGMHFVALAPKSLFPSEELVAEMKEIAISAARSYKEGVRGKLVIGASTTVCNYILPKRMNDFIEIFPDVVFKIKQGNSAEVINDVLDYSTDLGIVGSIVKNNNLEYSDFAEDELVLIVPNIKKYKSWRYEVSIEDVIKEKFITREKGSGTRKRFEEELKINDISRENIKKVAEFDSLEGVIRAVEEGLGVAVVSTISTSNFVGREKMKAIRIKNFNLIRKFYIVNHKNRVLNPATEKFKEFLLNK